MQHIKENKPKFTSRTVKNTSIITMYDLTHKFKVELSRLHRNIQYILFIRCFKLKNAEKYVENNILAVINKKKYSTAMCQTT